MEKVEREASLPDGQAQVEQLMYIDELRRFDQRLRLSGFARGMLAGAQQTLRWILNGWVPPVVAALTKEQRRVADLLIAGEEEAGD